MGLVFIVAPKVVFTCQREREREGAAILYSVTSNYVCTLHYTHTHVATGTHMCSTFPYRLSDYTLYISRLLKKAVY